MNIKKVEVGILNTNCYILEKDEECLIIDPGAEFEKINRNINKNVVGVLITHSHFDHVGALNDCLDYYNTLKYDFHNLKQGKNKVGSFEFVVNFNPGHTMDSISFIFDNIMFSGDFIFKGTIGRCDIGGDFSLMKKSIEIFLNNNIDYYIMPGHGEYTKFIDEINMLKSYVK